MHLALRAHEFKPIRHLGAHGCLVISTDIEAAALLGALRIERRDNGVPTGRQRVVHHSPVRGPVAGVGQEVEASAIVPQAEGSPRLESGNVALDPFNLHAPLALGLAAGPQRNL